MKRITILLLSILMLSACSSDDESIDDRLLGTWELIKTETYTDGKLSKTITPQEINLTSKLYFYDNGTGLFDNTIYNPETEQYKEMPLRFNFKNKGSSITLTDNEGSSGYQECFFRDNNNTLVIKTYAKEVYYLDYYSKI